MANPMFHGPVLLSPGDGVATTRITYDHAGNPSGFVPATFVGYVLSFPDRIPGSDMWSVSLDTGVTEFRTTQTLAIWPASQGGRP